MTGSTVETSAATAPPARRRPLAAAIQLVIMIALMALVLPAVSPGAAVKGDALIKLLFIGRIVLLLAVASWFLRLRKLGWADLGLRRPSWLRLMVAVPVGAAVAVGLVLVIRAALLRSGAHAATDYSMFDPLRKNLPLFLFFLVPVTWGTAAFGEEMLFRGFILDGLDRIFGGGGSRIAMVAAILLQAAIFGLLHLYQGPGGAATAGAIGAALGFVWWLSGRNLWPGIIVHGLFDSLSMTAIFLGAASH